MRTSSFPIAVLIALAIGCAPSFCIAQGNPSPAGNSGPGRRQVFNLSQLLASGKLANFSKTLTPLNAGDKQGVTCDGYVWLKDVHFSSGTIEVDLRGKNAFQQSFLGIVFHGVDTAVYDIIYFRPFNFRTSDSVRKGHSVQYCSMPGYPWERLRAERNGQFEKAIQPPPDPDQWFHARIEVHEKEVSVYVNGAKSPSLTIQKLNDRKDGLIGLWSSSYGVTGDFANLVITPENTDSRP